MEQQIPNLLEDYDPAEATAAGLGLHARTLRKLDAREVAEEIGITTKMVQQIILLLKKSPEMLGTEHVETLSEEFRETVNTARTNS